MRFDRPSRVSHENVQRFSAAHVLGQRCGTPTPHAKATSRSHRREQAESAMEVEAARSTWKRPTSRKRNRKPQPAAQPAKRPSPEALMETAALRSTCQRPASRSSAWKPERHAQPVKPPPSETPVGNRNASLHMETFPISNQTANATPVEAAPPLQRLNLSAAPRAIATASR